MRIFRFLAPTIMPVIRLSSGTLLPEPGWFVWFSAVSLSAYYPFTAAQLSQQWRRAGLVIPITLSCSSNSIYETIHEKICPSDADPL